MTLLPTNPTAFDYFHAIRAVASRTGQKLIFDLADAGMNLDDPMKVPSDGSEMRELLGSCADETECDPLDIANSLLHAADDHPCCKATLHAAANLLTNMTKPKP